MYVSGEDPYTKSDVFVARGDRERSRQRALLFYWKREERAHVREALQSWGRKDLIGKGPKYLVPPGPAYGAWKFWKRNKGQVRYDTHMGMSVERARKYEEDEQNWEAVVTPSSGCGV